MSSGEPCTLGVIPYLLSPDCKKHLRWIEDALRGKRQQVIYKGKSEEKVLHSSAHVNGGLVYLSDGESEEVADVHGLLLHLDVEDAHGVWKRAHAHGATTQMDLKVQSWGSLYGQFRDPFGFVWGVCKGPPNGVTAYLLAPGRNCEKMIEWVNEIFRGQTKSTHHWPDGNIMHCEISVNGGTLFMSDGPPDRVETPDAPNHSFILHLEVNTPSSTWKQALESGATSVVELKKQEWGDLFGMFRDEFGFQWSIMEPRDVTPHSGLIPTFLSPDCNKHIDWIKTVFSGVVRQLYLSPDNNKVAHCMMEINRGFLYICDASCVLEEEKGLLGEPRGVNFQLECKDPDTLWKKAMDNNATAVVPLKMQFWGELYGTFKDPFGYVWAVRRPELLANKTENENSKEK